MSADFEELYQFLLPSRLERLDSVLNNRSRNLTLVLDRVHNYHNISAVLRSADAFGITEVNFIGENFEYSKGIALGTERWLELKTHQDATSALEYLKKENYKIVVTAAEEKAEANSSYVSLPVYKLPFQEKLALVFGNEKRGVSKEIFDAASIHTFIPMFGFVESFNISVACAICLFCSSISGATGERQLPALNEEQKNYLKEKRVKQSLGSEADKILKEVEKRKKL